MPPLHFAILITSVLIAGGASAALIAGLPATGALPVLAAGAAAALLLARKRR